MFFQDHEKQIYSPKCAPESKFDPLGLDRTLTIASQGKLNELLKAWQASTDGEGDVGPGAREKNAIVSAEAEGKLVEVARWAFNLPPFPDSTDALALEYLCDFLEWMEGKGVRGKPPQS